MATPRTPQIPTLEKPYIVLVKRLGVWHIETFTTLPEAREAALRYRQVAHLSTICVTWLLEIIQDDN